MAVPAFDNSFVPSTNGHSAHGPPVAVQSRQSTSEADRLYIGALERKLAALKQRTKRRRSSLAERMDVDELDELAEGLEDVSAEAVDEGAALLAHDAVRNEADLSIVVDSPDESPKVSRAASVSDGLHGKAIRFNTSVRIAGGARRKPNEQARKLGSMPASILISNAINAHDERSPLLGSSPRSRRPSMSILYGSSPQLSTEPGTRASSPAPSLYVPLSEAAPTAPSPERLLNWLATTRRPSRLGSDSGYREALDEAQAAFQARKRRKRIKRYLAGVLFWRRWSQPDVPATSPDEEEPPAHASKTETEVRFGPAPGRWLSTSYWASKLRGVRNLLCCCARSDEDDAVIV